MTSSFWSLSQLTLVFQKMYSKLPESESTHESHPKMQLPQISRVNLCYFFIFFPYILPQTAVSTVKRNLLYLII